MKLPISCREANLSLKHLQPVTHHEFTSVWAGALQPNSNMWWATRGSAWGSNRTSEREKGGRLGGGQEKGESREVKRLRKVTRPPVQFSETTTCKHADLLESLATFAQ